jgi:hypothetical protein
VLVVAAVVVAVWLLLLVVTTADSTRLDGVVDADLGAVAVATVDVTSLLPEHPMVFGR